MFLADWTGCTANEIFQSFEEYNRNDEYDYSKYDGVEILLAYYSYEDYSGEAFVLFRKDNQLNEVNGTHCSCYGLENQWEPEKTTVEALQHRLDNGYFGRDFSSKRNVFYNELKQILETL